MRKVGVLDIFCSTARGNIELAQHYFDCMDTGGSLPCTNICEPYKKTKQRALTKKCNHFQTCAYINVVYYGFAWRYSGLFLHCGPNLFRFVWKTEVVKRQPVLLMERIRQGSFCFRITGFTVWKSHSCSFITLLCAFSSLSWLENVLIVISAARKCAFYWVESLTFSKVNSEKGENGICHLNSVAVDGCDLHFDGRTAKKPAALGLRCFQMALETLKGPF